MMLYPENPDDPRAKFPGITWPHTREEVAQMTAFNAKNAGDIGEKNMQKMGIDWVTFDGKRMKYWSVEKGEHYRIIVAAMRAKLEQNPKVKEILLSTGISSCVPITIRKKIRRRSGAIFRSGWTSGANSKRLQLGIDIASCRLSKIVDVRAH